MNWKVHALTAGLLLSGAAAAQVEPANQAGTLARQCADFTRGSAGNQTDQLICATRLTSFIAGWNAGVGRGMRSAFVLDSQNMETTKGIDDLNRRLDAIRPTTQCLAKSGVTFVHFMERYVAYVTARPERAAHDYDQVLTSMITDTLCR